MSDHASLRPSEFARQSLHALDASEGRRKRRKRDTTPDALGMSLKRELLERTTEADPEPDAYEAWLLQQTLIAEAPGPVRSMCREILDEYRFAFQDPNFKRWLSEGAPSADAESDSSA